MERPSARDLIDRCANGLEPGAWDSFVDRYGPALEMGVRRALRRVGGPGWADAEVQDLVQECYCRLLERGRRRLGSVRATADPEVRAWLVRFAERTGRDLLRSRRAEKRQAPRVAFQERPGRAGRLADPQGSPERRAIGRQRLRQFARRCRRLSSSERDARILHLVYLGGLTSREVADLSGGLMSPSSVDSVVYRFRRQLAKKGLPVPERASLRRGRRRHRRVRSARLQCAP